ncbi:TolC family protein [Candidatus Poribacteria bacterium]|nr:TolC family protein [Candidatus Poribacteria bacterium]
MPTCFRLLSCLGVAIFLLFGCAAIARAEEESPPPTAQETGVIEKSVTLGLRDVVMRALAANLDIAVEQYNPAIRDAELLSAQGTFDPTIKLDFSYSDEQVPQTTREGLASNAAETETITKDLSLTFSGTLTSGTEYEIFFDRSQSQFTQNNTFIDPDPLVIGDEFFGNVRNPSQYDLDLNFKLTQPLLKDFGFDANLADIRIARTARDISVEDFRKSVMDTVAEVESAYWDLFLTIENLKVAESSLGLARDLLKENRIRLEVGTMARLEVLQADTGVAQREGDVIVARSQVKDAEDNLKRLLNLPKDTEDWKLRIVPADEPSTIERQVDLLTELNLAMENRPDYKSSLLQIESDAINERFTRNQLLPSVDLTSEYEFRAVDAELHNAFDDIERGTSPSWLAGGTAEYPIGNREAKGNYKKAQLEKLQSEKETANLRLSIIVEVNKAVRDIETGLKRISVTRKATELGEESLKAERKKLEVGVSTSHLVLQFEEELADARRREIAAKIDYRKALIALAAATGNLLKENNIVVDETL